ncbi:MAG: hypothetical protein A3D44_03385 [Candidatus Staskawiczbacteria bacterium RIFCSPHIGHO2_02_FULL_42_22]|uniref:Uncharacterized protein n=1 Tax=Candidatus Staskawiczbacteria bacterium RIFCSPHIGHO2_02_FULL_42_22 TaxID=1802207 RepID=A0A1G2I442_9BACT|nr:MAG: hypothetical protein A3D44_03385 [Candidatus Staskawiczbacteria bacterium RIFCSPHIGHO2_02_FULL_42_22]
MRCIICQKRVSESEDCCKQCQESYRPEEINNVRVAKAEADVWRTLVKETLEAEKKAIEEERWRIRSLWNKLM